MAFEGSAFMSAWRAATDAGRAAATAIGTGAKKVGDAAFEGAAKTAKATVKAAKWAAARTAEAAGWAMDKAAKGLSKALALAKEAASLAGEVLKAAAETFKEGVKAVGGLLLCLVKPDPLTPEEQKQAQALLDRLPAEDAKSISDLAYDGSVGDKTADGQWRVIEVREDPLTGYRSIVVESTNPNDSRKVLGFAGTEFGSVGEAVPDLVTDAGQHFGGIPGQYQQAYGDAAELQERYGDDLLLTGHSLGGGQGNFASEMLGIPAVTINSAPLGIGSQAAIAVLGDGNQGSNSLTLATGNDLVSVIGTAGSPAHPGLVAPVGSTTGGNPLYDHMLDNFDPGAVELAPYSGPSTPTPSSSSCGPGESESNFPTFD